ncbi:head-tail connector protein [Lactobacillus sp.]|uniref:head-tail connector protein n=1 Tax=Lactobacillus sp. TaxID=1591 RepID=UPI0025885879|nr:head-tail connector protein [Lactobacillus sp.]MCO6528983.1 phage gp6-like head-tail connector protein [Lactobacillus sp.]MCO6530582.1 phage gp6-like head-tail connector protein [Lactobacillus sp.]
MNESNQLIDPKQLLEELHIDDTSEEETTIRNLVSMAKAIVDEAIQDINNSELAQDELYISAIKTLATQLYYDRTLSEGKAPAVQLLIAHLQFKYGGSNHGA